MNSKIVFIGAGNMAEAIVSGMIAGQCCAPENIVMTDVIPERLTALAEKYGVSDPRVVTSARVLTLIGALLCAGLAASGLFLPYFGALPKLLLFFAGLAVSVLLILRPCAQLRRSCNKERL